MDVPSFNHCIKCRPTALTWMFALGLTLMLAAPRATAADPTGPPAPSGGVQRLISPPIGMATPAVYISPEELAADDATLKLISFAAAEPISTVEPVNTTEPISTTIGDGLFRFVGQQEEKKTEKKTKKQEPVEGEPVSPSDSSDREKEPFADDEPAMDDQDEEAKDAKDAALSSDAKSAKEKVKDKETTYGEKPVSNSLQFLRQQDVLLDPGKYQFDAGFIYTLFHNNFPVPITDNATGDVVDVVQGHIRRRLLFSPFALRYGLTKDVQVFGFLPVGYSNTQISTIGVSDSTDITGLGDLTAGANFHVLQGEEECPDVIATIAATAPTGKFSSPIFGLAPGLGLGQGFWALSAQVLAINNYDPIIVFYGAGYRQLFERTFDGVAFEPGGQINYQLGVGFAVNDRVTLSAAFQGFYITTSRQAGVEVPGTNLEPMSLRFAATISKNCKIIEPFALIGMTEFAPAAQVGVVWTWY